MTFTRILVIFLTFIYSFFASFFCALPFDLVNYEQFVEDEQYTSELVLGEIPTWKKAKEQALIVLEDYYGDWIHSRRHVVYFDRQNDAWLVKGILAPFLVGSEPSIIIQKSDGKVLAVWR